MTTMRYIRSPWFALWLIAVLLLLFLSFNPVDAHEGDGRNDGNILYCQAEDDLGVMTFPIGSTPDLLLLCKDVEGVQVLVPDPGPEELIEQMYNIGLYEPFFILQSMLLEGTDLEIDDAPSDGQTEDEE